MQDNRVWKTDKYVGAIPASANLKIGQLNDDELVIKPQGVETK